MFSNALLIICVALIVICLRSFALWREQGLRLEEARELNHELVRELNDRNGLIEELDTRLDDHAAYITELEGILDNQQLSDADVEEELRDRIAHLERVLDMGSDKVRELEEARKELRAYNDDLYQEVQGLLRDKRAQEQEVSELVARVQRKDQRINDLQSMLSHAAQRIESYER